MAIVTLREMRQQFARYSKEAATRPVGVSKKGHLSFIMVPVEEYRRLRRRERIAGRIEDLSDEMIEAIRNIEPRLRSEEAETRLKRIEA